MAKYHSLSIILFLYLSISLIQAIYVPKDNILLSCGNPTPETTDTDGRKWVSDIGSKLGGENSFTSPAATQDPSVPPIPYMSARVFLSDFTYSFTVTTPGRLFIRLYFYPNSYHGLNASDALFSVSAFDDSSTSYTLLKNFNCSQTADAMNFAFIVREYSVNVESNLLNVVFMPDSPDSYAFVNGIEIVSMPDVYNTADGHSLIVGQNTPFYIDNSTALENVYRLNVGGSDISVLGDTGLYRPWYDDSTYIFGAAFGVTESIDPNVTVNYTLSVPSYVAPVDVYSTARSMGPDWHINVNYNLTWIFSVDSGFSYLVRLHFCEISQNMTKINQRAFEIFINNKTADAHADVIGWTQHNGVPIYKDFVVLVPGAGNSSPQQDLWLALHPDTSSKSQFYDAILNGVEIFKISDMSGNLAGPNPIPAPKVQSIIDTSLVKPSSGSGNSEKKTVIITGVGILLALFVGFAFFAVSRRRRVKKGSSNACVGSSGWLPLSLYGNSHTAASTTSSSAATTSFASTMPSNICRHFSFAEIKAATKKFDESLIIGVGGFGKVYKGEIDGGATKVAIKRGNPLSDQGINEFQTEIELLSKLRHRHLVSLIGYCEENNEMILVYDYMGFGTLREHLYKTQLPPLSWKQRLEICIGSARGLHYLHTGAKYCIIHRDVKTTNILLDEKWVAKVSDFGLSKTGPTTLDQTHVSTVVKGSFGYLDPEYFRRQQLTEKSDVYSFGVVLFEVLCARPALNPSLPKEQVSLAEWALHCQKKGILDQITDPYLKGKIAPECFSKFADTATKCVGDHGIDRPSMGDVLWNLEFAMQLQESAEESGKGIKVIDTEEEVFDGSCGGKKDSKCSAGFDANNGTDSISAMSMASVDSDGLTPSTIFSQIMNPNGR